MAAHTERSFFGKLTTRSKVIIVAAVFALFAPLPLVLISPVGADFTWLQIVAWLVLGGAIAATWAYFYFEQRLMWLPPIVTVLLSLAFPLTELLAFGSPVTSTLAVSIAAVALVVIGYVGFVTFISIEGTRTVRMQAEMDVARRIHSYLVPDIALDHERYEISGTSLASAEMGGDVIDVTEVNGLPCVTIADVSGHGVPAGILMSALKGSLLTSLSLDNEQRVDSSFLKRVNATFHRISSPDMYCTLATVVLGPGRACSILNSGHSATFHFRSSTGAVELIPSTGIPIGVLSDFACETKQVELSPGDVLALVTDGITETADADGTMLGDEPIVKLLAEIADLSAEQINRGLFDLASEFGVSDDDRSVVVIKVKAG